MAGVLGGCGCSIVCSCLIFTERKGVSRVGIWEEGSGMYRRNVEKMCVF